MAIRAVDLLRPRAPWAAIRMNPGFWIPALVASAVSLAVPFALRPLLTRFEIVDIPNERSSHSALTLRAGGLAQVAGVIAGLVVCLLATSLCTADSAVLTAVLVGGLSAGMVGLVDDLVSGRGVPVVIRGGLQLLIGLSVGSALTVLVSGDAWAVFGSGVMIAAYTNIANFVDGINGISGMHGALAGAAYSVIGLLAGLPWLVVAGLLLATVYLAFLPWNLLGAGMFLGDVGSYLLGASLAGCAAGAILSGVPWVSALAPLAVFSADALTTLVRRALRGEPVFRGHRTHAYQRLTNTGLSHLQVTAVASLLTLVSAGAGIVMLAGLWPAPLAGAVVLLAAATFVLLPRLRGDRLPSVPSAQLALPPWPADTPARPGFTPRRWAVVGGSGFIGSAIVQDLHQRGMEVVSVPAPRVRLDPTAIEGGEVAAAAQQDPAVPELARHLAGVDVVVNAAGLASPDAPASAELYGANALLPAIVCHAARAAGVARLVHVSSAAVQGRRDVLDETAETAPFSPYSRSKALGESALLTMLSERAPSAETDGIIVRATSVQGLGRGTTDSLRRIARSPLASVAAPGTQPTVVSSLTGLVSSIHQIGVSQVALPPIVLQPWDGLTVSDVLRLSGDREPKRLPVWLCRTVVWMGWVLGHVVPELAALARRLELMWFGQRQVDSAIGTSGSDARTFLRSVMRGRDG